MSHWYRRLGWAVAVMAIGGCRVSTDAVQNGALVGRWGGDQIEVTAGATRATVRLTCTQLEFKAPIVPGTDGGFVLPVAATSTGGVRPNPPTLLSGQVSGTQLTVRLHFVVRDTAKTATFVAMRDRAARLDGFCTL